MPEAERNAQQPAGQSFHEAIAQWRLLVHTEVKRASSLPTAMFDATDPMLEMRLAASTEAMLAQLQQPEPVSSADESIERRIEHIDPAELRRLPIRIGERAPRPVDLLSNLGSEYLGVLADACYSQTGTAQQRAAEHLCTDFDLTATNLGEATAELLRLAHELVEGYPEGAAWIHADDIIQRVSEVLRAHCPAQKARPTP